MILMTGILSLLLAVSPMTASFYGEAFHGRPTANGETYDQHALTAAHVDLPFGTRLWVEGPQGSAVVRINDRGPYCFSALAEGRLEPHPTRDIDLSRAAFDAVADLGEGIVEVAVTEIPEDITPGLPPPPWVPPPGVTIPQWEVPE